MRRRIAVQHARDKGISERHACRLAGQWRTTQRYQPTQCEDEDRLDQSILALASKYGRFGYRPITALLKLAGWKVGKHRVQRIWPQSRVELRFRRSSHARWAQSAIAGADRRYTRECLAIRVARRLNSTHVIELPGDCMLEYGVPEHVRSDNGAEMTARRVKWLASVGTKPLFIEPGGPRENGYCESFNGERDECLNGEIFYSFIEAQVVIRAMAEVLQHSTSTQRVGLSAARAAELDRGSMKRALRLPSPAGWCLRPAAAAVKALR